MKEFGILLFGHTRPLFIADVLLSLEKQDGIKYVDVWIDGHQGNKYIKTKTEQVNNIVKNFSVNKIYKHNGNLGFRKIMLQALVVAINEYKKIMILEDDCFPTKDAVDTFKVGLDEIELHPDIFSIYGHHFLVKAEKDTCTRFQGWGWGTTSNKLKPILDQLIECYSYTEEYYLNFIRSVLTTEIINRIDVTPPRIATKTLKEFFAWDETVTLLTAMAGLVHKRTEKRTIYNFGAGEDSARFDHISEYEYRKPPYNMISHDEIWNYF